MCDCAFELFITFKDRNMVKSSLSCKWAMVMWGGSETPLCRRTWFMRASFDNAGASRGPTSAESLIRKHPSHQLANAIWEDKADKEQRRRERYIDNLHKWQNRLVMELRRENRCLALVSNRIHTACALSTAWFGSELSQGCLALGFCNASQWQVVQC